MANAACEVHKHKNSNNNNNQTSSSDIVNVNIRVSGDEALQKRGYFWLNGVVTLIANGKCIDNEVMSKKGKQCEIWESKKGIQEYNDCKYEYSCSVNLKEVQGQWKLTGWRKF